MSAGAAADGLGATTPSPVAGDASAGVSLSPWSILGNLPPHAKQILNSQRGQTLVRVVFRFIQRVFIAEAGLWLTALFCALLGFPAVLTAFCVALVGFVVNLWLAVTTLAPVCRKFFKGGRA